MKKSSLKEIPQANVMHLADSHSDLSLLEPVALFRLLFNEEIYSLIACETGRYASQWIEVIHLTLQESEAFVNASLQQFGVFAKDLAINEQTTSYFGKHSAKMFIHGKPIRFGYNWVLASSDGYPYKFETYTRMCDTKVSTKPLGPQVVSALLSIVKNPACHCVYFDNFLYLIIYSKIFTKRISGLLGLLAKVVQLPTATIKKC